MEVSDETGHCDQPDELDSDENGAAGALQFFVSSAAADTPLVNPLLTSWVGQHGRLTADDSLETADVSGGGGGDAVIDFTALISPSKVSMCCCTLSVVDLISYIW